MIVIQTKNNDNLLTVLSDVRQQLKRERIYLIDNCSDRIGNYMHKIQYEHIPKYPIDHERLLINLLPNNLGLYGAISRSLVVDNENNFIFISPDSLNPESFYYISKIQLSNLNNGSFYKLDNGTFFITRELLEKIFIEDDKFVYPYTYSKINNDDNHYDSDNDIVDYNSLYLNILSIIESKLVQ